MPKPQTDEELLKELKHHAVYLKHGPRGRGGDGPCDPDCVKCSVEADIHELEEKLAATQPTS